MTPEYDVLIVGAGLAGCIAATRLIRSGIRVKVLDRLSEPSDEFRAEQIVGVQAHGLRQQGLLAPLALCARRSGWTWNYHRGAMLDGTAVEQYGLRYQDMVRAVRHTLPSGSLITGRVTSVVTSDTVQKVHLDGGEVFTARLVIIATGLMPQLSNSLQIEWEMRSEAHSLCLGFGLELTDARQNRRLPITYYHENIRDRCDYLALFRMGDGIRANLFCYNRRDDPWTQGFIDRPEQELNTTLPGLRRVIGNWKIVGPIDVRRNDIKVATNVRQGGVVLIGDAFQTPCPAAGTGIDRILSDVAALQRVVPTWLKGDKISAEKIAQFYDDPLKQAFDAECLRIARYRRDAATKEGLRWRFHRFRVRLQRRSRWMARSVLIGAKTP